MDWKVRIGKYIRHSDVWVRFLIILGICIFFGVVGTVIAAGIKFLFFDLLNLPQSSSGENFKKFGGIIGFIVGAVVFYIIDSEAEKRESPKISTGKPERILNFEMIAGYAGAPGVRKREFWRREIPDALIVTKNRLLFLRQSADLPFLGPLFSFWFGQQTILQKAGKMDEGDSDKISPQQIEKLKSQFAFKEYLHQEIREITTTKDYGKLEFDIYLTSGETLKYKLGDDFLSFIEPLNKVLMEFKKGI